MNPAKNITLKSAEYYSDYKFRFLFSDGNESIVDFKKALYHGTSLRKYLDVTKFKKMKFDRKRGDIYWGKNYDMCFHIESIYREKIITIH